MYAEPIIAFRFLLYVTLLSSFGLPLFWLYAFDGGQRHAPSLPSTTLLQVALLLIALIGGFVAVVLTSAAMADASLANLDQEVFRTIVFQTPIGAAWQVRTVSIMLALGSLLTHRHRHGALHLSGTMICGGVALASLAWNGHGAAGEGIAGTARLIADVAHLLAAGTWVGSLVAFVRLLFTSQTTRTLDGAALLASALARFATMGTIAVVALAGTGLVNVYLLVGPAHVADLGKSPYGQLLLVKLGAFAAMLGLAALNRFRLTGRLERALASGDVRAAVVALRLSVGFEAGAAIVILGIVAWMGTLEPPL